MVSEEDFKIAINNIRNNNIKEKYIYSFMNEIVSFDEINDIEDLAFLIAYCRPYWLDELGKIDFKIFHKTPQSFKDKLSKTRGLLVYQEDFIEILNERIISKDTCYMILRRFLKYENHNCELFLRKFSKEEIEFLEYYSRSLFRKSHAIAYAYSTILDHL